MSGVCGVVDFGPPVAGADLAPMVARAPHRSLEGAAVWAEGPVGLAHLCSFSTGEAAAGPTVHRAPASGVTVVADARIDNWTEVVARLGLPSDHSGVSALIAAAYERWGTASVSQLVGDFAFALWDPALRQLLLARDPMGMRPLYHSLSGGRFLFSSEINQLLADATVREELDDVYLSRYLQGDFRDQERTPYVGVQQLPAGHLLTYSGTSPSIQRWWEVPEVTQRHVDDDNTQEFLSLFTEAVRCRLPLAQDAGILLSGGLDSGSIASIAGGLRERAGAPSGTLRAYSFAFETLTECDERHVSSIIADRFALPVTEVSAERFHPLSAGAPPHVDGPFSGVFQPALEACLSEAQNHGVRQMFSGDRGDLILGGFSPDLRVLARRPGSLIDELRRQHAWSSVPYASLVFTELLAPTLRRLRRVRPADVGRRLAPQRPEVSAPSWVLQSRGPEPAYSTTPAVPHGRDLGHWQTQRLGMIFDPMQLHGMVWSNRTYASHGQGFVDPWSDVRLVRWALAMPPGVLHTRSTVDKVFLRNAMSGHMPESARRTAGKFVPTPLWRRAVTDWANARVRSLVQDTVLESEGFIDGDVLRSYQRSLTADGPIAPTFWWALSAEQWLRAHWA